MNSWKTIFFLLVLQFVFLLSNVMAFCVDIDLLTDRTGIIIIIVVYLLIYFSNVYLVLRQKLGKDYGIYKSSIVKYLNFAVIDFSGIIDKEIRGVVFLEDKKKTHISIEFTSDNRIGEPDNDIRFIPYQGVAGLAWAEKKPKKGDLRNKSEEDLREKWHLEESQIYKTRKIQSIICEPLFISSSTSEKKCIGVLVFDSKYDVMEYFNSDAIIVVKRYARIIDGLLNQYYNEKINIIKIILEYFQ